MIKKFVSLWCIQICVALVCVFTIFSANYLYRTRINQFFCEGSSCCRKTSIESISQSFMNSYETMRALGYKPVITNLSKEYIQNLEQHIPASRPNDFRRLLERSRAFRNAFERLEAVHTMVCDNFTGYTRQPILPHGTSYSLMEQFIQLEIQLEKSIFPFISQHYRYAMDIKHSFNGRGIVYAIGNKHTAMVLAHIRLLRYLGCDLPVEIFYIGENDLNFTNRARLQRLPLVEIRDIYKVMNDSSVKVSGWALKPFAVLFSRFAEVILMDGDVIFLQDPSVLFDHPEYQQAQILFYYDRTLDGRNNKTIDWITNLFGKPLSKRLFRSNRILMGLSHDNQESGVVVINKVARFTGLLLTCKLNSMEERNAVTYQMFHGDKESFWLAQEMVDDDYAFDSQLPGTMGIIDPHFRSNDTEVQICATQLVHFDKHGKIFWFNQYMFEDKLKQPLVLAKFEYYLKEPGVWECLRFRLNFCCLRVKGKPFTLTSRGKEIIAQIRHYWTEETATS